MLWLKGSSLHLNSVVSKAVPPTKSYLKSVLDRLLNHLPHTHSFKTQKQCCCYKQNFCLFWSRRARKKKKAFSQLRRDSWPRCVGQARQTGLCWPGRRRWVSKSQRNSDWKASCLQMNDPVFTPSRA